MTTPSKAQSFALDRLLTSLRALAVDSAALTVAVESGVIYSVEREARNVVATCRDEASKRVHDSDVDNVFRYDLVGLAALYVARSCAVAHASQRSSERFAVHATRLLDWDDARAGP